MIGLYIYFDDLSFYFKFQTKPYLYGKFWYIRIPSVIYGKFFFIIFEVNLLEGIAKTGVVELGDVKLAAYLSEKRSTGQPFFRNGM